MSESAELTRIKTKKRWDANSPICNWCEPETRRIMEELNTTEFTPHSWMAVDAVICKLKGIKAEKFI